MIIPIHAIENKERRQKTSFTHLTSYFREPTALCKCKTPFLIHIEKSEKKKKIQTQKRGLEKRKHCMDESAQIHIQSYFIKVIVIKLLIKIWNANRTCVVIVL